MVQTLKTGPRLMLGFGAMALVIVALTAAMANTLTTFETQAGRALALAADPATTPALRQAVAAMHATAAGSVTDALLTWLGALVLGLGAAWLIARGIVTATGALTQAATETDGAGHSLAETAGELRRLTDDLAHTLRGFLTEIRADRAAGRSGSLDFKQHHEKRVNGCAIIGQRQGQLAICPHLAALVDHFHKHTLFRFTRFQYGLVITRDALVQALEDLVSIATGNAGAVDRVDRSAYEAVAVPDTTRRATLHMHDFHMA